jgi:hypothetical protein
MTYHHLNRFKAHAEATLAPNERLLAWHFAYETRAKTGTYSESIRRLEETLDLNEKTIRKAAAKLVRLGLFELAKSAKGTYAPVYRFLGQCPPNCLDISDHNTKQELEAIKTLGVPNRPTLDSNQTPPYIKKREEEDIAKTFQEGSEELGLLLQALESFKTLDSQQEELLLIAKTRPKAMAEAVLEMLAKVTPALDSPRRKLNYLAKVIRLTPQNLLSKFNEEKTAEKGELLLQASKEGQLKKVNNGAYEPNHLPERITSYANKVLEGFKPNKSQYWLNMLGAEVTAKHIYAASHLEELVSALDKNLLGEDFWDKGFLKMNEETKLPQLFWEDLAGRSFVLSEEVAVTLLTAEEKIIYDTRTAGLTLLKNAWNTANPELEGSRKFYDQPEVIQFFAANPEPKGFRYGQKLLDLLNTQLAKQISDYLEAPEQAQDPKGTYRDYLKENFTFEDDLRFLLRFIPSRPEGHNLKGFAKAYLEVSQTLTFEEVLFKLKRKCWEDYGHLDGNTKGDKYTKAPDKFLLEVIEETKWIDQLRAQSI